MPMRMAWKNRSGAGPTFQLACGKSSLDWEAWPLTGLKKKQLYFTDVELKEAGMPAAALELGLLTKAESASFWKRDEYTFSHLTLQEFLATLYVSTAVLKTKADMAKLLKQVRLADSHLSTFWVFLAGLLSSSMADVLLCALCDWLCQSFALGYPLAKYFSSIDASLKVILEKAALHLLASATS